MKHPFTSELIQKLNKVKRDQEVREALGSSLDKFKVIYSKVVESQRERALKDRSRTLIQENKQSKEPVLLSSRKKIADRSKEFCPKPQAKSKHVTFKISSKDDFTTVGYYFRGDLAPYCTNVKGKRTTLGQFKKLICRKGDFRYYFKRYCNAFETRVVYEELTDDEQVLPLFDGYIFAMIESIT